MPLNFKRYKQSRIYIRDECFWLNGVSFEPMRHSQGSYLSVFAHWLWHPQGRLSLDYGGGLRMCTPEYGNFIQYIDPEQFAAAAKNFAEAAAGRGGSWPAFHAAVACGLPGDVMTARRMFTAVGMTVTIGGAPIWLTNLMALSVRMADAVADPQTFRRIVQELLGCNCALYGLADNGKRLAFD